MIVTLRSFPQKINSKLGTFYFVKKYKKAYVYKYFNSICRNNYYCYITRQKSRTLQPINNNYSKSAGFFILTRLLERHKPISF